MTYLRVDSGFLNIFEQGCKLGIGADRQSEVEYERAACPSCHGEEQFLKAAALHALQSSP